MQELIAVNGIVLSSSPVGEADKRVVLLTKELGRISCFARGARRMNSPLTGLTRTFSAGKFYLTPGRDAYSLSRAEIRDYFEELVRDVEGTAYGCYFLELAGFFSRENSAEPGVLNLLYLSLRALLRPGLPNELVRRVFELRLFRENGILPDFSRCGICGRALSGAYFHPGLLEPVCKECAKKTPGPELSGSALYALGYIAGAPLQRLYTFRVSSEVQGALASVSEILSRRFVDREIRSRELLSVLVPDSQKET